MSATDTIAEIIRLAAEEFGVHPSRLTDPSRGTELTTLARFAAIAAIFERVDMLTLRHVGDIFGGRDHGTIIHAKRRHQELMTTLPGYAKRFRAVLRSVGES